MTSAYILINTKAGYEYTVYEILKDIGGVVETTIVYGVYDIVLKTETSGDEQLKEIIDQIRKVDKIKSTLTLIGI
ncbi:MAG: Lrp/AsnC ligand binding domain-containing protein [Archaeoglobaceae archaeon]